MRNTTITSNDDAQEGIAYNALGGPSQPGNVEFSELMLSLYRGAREVPLEEFQDAALSLIKPWIAFDSCRWGSATLTSSGWSYHMAHLHNEPEDMLDQYEEVKHQDISVIGIVNQEQRVLTFNTAALFRDKVFSGIRNYTKRLRHENSLVATHFDDRGQFVKYASLYRADPDMFFNRRDGQLAAALFPHLLEALAINRLAHLEHLEPAGAMRRYHLAIADRRGILYHSEPGFLDLLDREAVGAPHKRLPETVLATLQCGQAFKGRAIVLLARTDGDLLFLKARPRVLADGLSPREIQVAREVANGHSYKEIARELRMSPSTARNHIHAVHAKLQVDNKASLTTQLQLIE